MENDKKLVLLVEKDAGLTNIYRIGFESAGFDVETANSGSESLSKIKNIQDGKGRKPDLILLNAVLPDMSGAELLKEIKSNEVTKNIPIFILSFYRKNNYPEIIKFNPEKFLIKTEVKPTELVSLAKETLGL